LNGIQEVRSSILLSSTQKNPWNNWFWGLFYSITKTYPKLFDYIPMFLFIL